MPRRALNLVTALSLLVFVCVAIVWVRSHVSEGTHEFRRDRPLFGEFAAGPVHYELRLAGGEIGLLSVQGFRERRSFTWFLGPGPVVTPMNFTIDTLTSTAVGPVTVTSGTGSMMVGSDLRGPTIARGVPFRATSLSLWFPALLALALPAARVARRRNRARRRATLLAAGRCPSCGYDLTGNVSGACPECGKVPAAGAMGEPVSSHAGS
jgi:hypothetical protein